MTLFEKFTGRKRSALSWVSSQDFSKPLPLGQIEAEVIERTVPGMVVRTPAPRPTDEGLSRDEIKVLSMRIRVTRALSEAHGLRLSREDHQRLIEAPLGSWGQFEQGEPDDGQKPPSTQA